MSNLLDSESIVGVENEDFDFEVLEHHLEPIQQILLEIYNLINYWPAIQKHLVSPKEIPKIDREPNFGNQVLKTLRIWRVEKSQQAEGVPLFSQLLNIIKPYNKSAADELEEKREMIRNNSSDL